MAARDLPGFVLGPSKCNRLSLEEKIKFVHEIAQWSKDAPEILSSFTRRDLLEVICAEMGKERKYPGYSKSKMIELLLKLVSSKLNSSSSDHADALATMEADIGISMERQKESQIQVSTDLKHSSLENDEKHVQKRVCKNTACRATLSPDDVFCRRCSCCICHYYDDNKDPTLWLTCSPDSTGEKSCGLTCHLVCALKDQRAGIMKNNYRPKVDGIFHCTSCGKINGLMDTWRKQLTIAREARRVDVLCQRVLLSYRILTGTKQYKAIKNVIQTAMEMLKNELGPLDMVCAKMARGIVNRLPCGAEVQKLCASALEAFDSISPRSYPTNAENVEPDSLAFQIRFEESSATSVIVVLDYMENQFRNFQCILWHRRFTVKDYPEKPSFVVSKPEKKCKIAGLSPSTEYICKAAILSGETILSECEAKWITPTLKRKKEEESTLSSQTHSEVKSIQNGINDLAFEAHTKQQKSGKKANQSKKEGSHLLEPSMGASLTSFGSLGPSTPCKFTSTPEVLGFELRKQANESSYDFSVRAIKWLEHEGCIENDFRVKFLTWFSLKATGQERRVVNVFVDAMIDHPPSLAEQLVHSFTDVICCEHKLVPFSGSCNRC